MKRLKELLQQLTLHFQVEIAIADVLEEQGHLIDKERDINVKQNLKIDSLEKRYGELLMVLNDINKKIK